MPFFVDGLTPGCAEGLRRNLDIDMIVGAQVEVPVGVLVGSAFRPDDDDLAADIAVDQRNDARLTGFATPHLDQTVRGERVATDLGDVHDVALRAARLQVDIAVLGHPVAALLPDCRG
jgi:hypothetical protein